MMNSIVKKLLFILFFVLILLFAIYISRTLEQKAPLPSASSAANPLPQGLVRVTRVVDGDTIEIEGGKKVRYIGMNTPETVDPRRAVECFGKEASQENKELLRDKAVRLEKDVSETDKFGRLLRYVYLADGTFVNLQLVRQGFAQVATYPPDVAHQQEFIDAQRLAQQEKRGLWNSCK